MNANRMDSPSLSSGTPGAPSMEHQASTEHKGPPISNTSGPSVPTEGGTPSTQPKAQIEIEDCSDILMGDGKWMEGIEGLQDPEKKAKVPDEHDIEERLREAAEMQLDEELIEAAFKELQPVCSVLLMQEDARSLTRGLEELRDKAKKVPQKGLAGCLDYVLFPLKIMLASVIQAHCPAQLAGMSSSNGPPRPALPIVAGQRTSETVVSCTAAVLSCAGGCPHPETAIQLLEQMSPLMALKHGDASEELRLEVFKALESLLGSIPSAPSGKVVRLLRREVHAPLVGYMVSSFIQAADGEVSAGAAGSRSVRASALRCVRALVKAVGDADALAFFLPGIVTGLTRALRAAGLVYGEDATRTGAASGGTTTAEALEALSATLLLALGDATTPPISASARAGAPDGLPAAEPVVADANEALEMLQKMSLQKEGPAHLHEGAAGAGPEEEAFVAEEDDDEDDDEKEEEEKPGSDKGGSAPQRRLRVKRTSKWARRTRTQVCRLLTASLPGLCEHPSTAVRMALLRASGALLRGCRATLAPCCSALLDIIFALAQDDYPQVSSGAQEWLCKSAASEDGLGDWLSSEAALGIEGAIARLPRAVRSGEGQGVVAARRAATALRVACLRPSPRGPPVLGQPHGRQSLVTALLRCFAFERSGLELLLLQARLQAAPPARDQAPPAALKAHGGEEAHRQPQQVPDEPGSSSGRHAPAAEGSALPRMPAGLALLTTRRSYLAVAELARTAGRMAAVADARGSNVLRALVDPLVEELRKADDDNGTGNGCVEAAAAAAVLSEIIFGASAAWSSSASRIDGAARSPVQGGHQEGGSSLPPEGAPGLADLSAQVLGELLADRCWGAPLRQALLNADPDTLSQDRVSAQSAGEGVLLLRGATEAAGTLAVALGPRFATDGRLLRRALLPLLEVAGAEAAAPAAAASARTALAAIADAAGLPWPSGSPLQPLVAANMDYVVDGVCRHLRNLESNSQAPALLAALMREAGVAPALLPLMAEPVRNALSGLTVTARRRHPHHTRALLQCLTHMVAGAERDSATVYASAVEAARGLDALLGEADKEDRRRRDERERWEERRSRGRGEDGRSKEGGEVMGDEIDIEDLDPVSDLMGSEDAVRLFFEGHHADKAAAEGQSMHPRPAMMHEEPREPSARSLVKLTPDQLADIEQRHRRAHAVAVMAQSIAEVAAPLMSAADLRTSLQALEVAATCLRALKSSSGTLEAAEEMVEAIGGKEELERLQAPKPKSPTLLPAVHLFWGPLASSCLRDPRPPVLDAALAFLQSASEVSGGQFLARRFSAEAWPLLERILKAGESAGQQRALAKVRQGGRGASDASVGEATAAGAARLRCAVLDLLAALGRSDWGRATLRFCCLPAARAATQLLRDPACEQQSKATTAPTPAFLVAAVKEAALGACEGLAMMNPDAVWLLLTEMTMSEQVGPLAPGASGAIKAPPSGLLPVHKLLGAALPRPALLRLQPPRAIEAAAEKQSLPEEDEQQQHQQQQRAPSDGSSATMALLGRVCAIEAPWRQRADKEMMAAVAATAL